MSSLNRERLQRLQSLLVQHGLDCYICCTHISMGYLAEFFEGGGERMLVMMIPKSGQPAMIVPTLSETHAKHTAIADIRSWNDGQDPAELFRLLASEWKLEAAVIGVDDEMPAGYLLPMQRVLPAALFRCGGDTMAELRKRKDADELQKMKRAARIAEEAFEDLREKLRPKLSERDGVMVLHEGMMKRGAPPTFAIVAAGANGAEPHHDSDSTQISNGDVIVIDWGCQVDHYLSDITRTVAVGHASNEAKKVYDIVYRAHMAARGAIRPGVTCESIDAAARKVIEDAGYGEYFVHRTGHGIGMMGHEPPHIVKGSTSQLEVGQCFSVEPGIYLPGKFGVRIENIVTVTESGHESLNSEPPSELPVIG